MASVAMAMRPGRLAARPSPSPHRPPVSAVPAAMPAPFARARRARRHPPPLSAASAPPPAPPPPPEEPPQSDDDSAIPSAVDELWRRDAAYIGARARRDAATVAAAHGHVVAALNPAVREAASVAELRTRLDALRSELRGALETVADREARVTATLGRLGAMESRLAALTGRPASDILESTVAQAALADPESAEAAVVRRSDAAAAAAAASRAASIRPAPPGAAFSRQSALRNAWLPVAFSGAVGPGTLLPFELLGEPWVLFRDVTGQLGCVKDECAHRACPVSLGKVTPEGRVQCPYHGWEYTTSGLCQVMPSTRFQKGVVIAALPCVERSGLALVWPGDGSPAAEVPTYALPPGFVADAETTVEFPADHGLILESLLGQPPEPETGPPAFGPPVAVTRRSGTGTSAKLRLTVCLPAKPGYARVLVRSASLAGVARRLATAAAAAVGRLVPTVVPLPAAPWDAAAGDAVKRELAVAVAAHQASLEVAK